ncbi:MAG TPA: hypothetical protein VF599_02220 [Pyrinomonadaceae bacterium]|jgi:hypothetical protein
MKTFQTGAAARQFSLNGKSRRAPLLLSFGLLAILAVIMITGEKAGSVGAQAAQKQIKGEWNAEFDRNKAGEIHFRFQRRSANGSFNMTGENLRVGELQGLPAAARAAARIDVSFNIVREAGTFACEGYFSEGRGTGFWTLTPSEKFVAEMRARGYGNLTEENLLSAALHDLTIKYLEDLKAAGYDKLTFEQLRRAQTHDITVQYIREMKAAGYENLTVEELVRARNHNIDAAFVSDARAMGFERQPLEKLIRMRNHDITREFIDEMKSAGFENLSIDGLIRLKNHDVTADFISEIKAEGYADVSAETAIRLKNHEVDREFIRRAKSQGYNNASLEELIRLRNRGTVK